MGLCSSMLLYVVGDSARSSSTCIIVERLIFGDCDDLVVRAFNWCIVCYLCLHSLLIYV